MAKFLRRARSKKEIPHDSVEESSSINADAQDQNPARETVEVTETDYVFEESPGEILDTRIRQKIDTEVKADLETCEEGDDIEETGYKQVEATLQKAQLVKGDGPSSDGKRDVKADSRSSDGKREVKVDSRSSEGQREVKGDSRSSEGQREVKIDSPTRSGGQREMLDITDNIEEQKGKDCTGTINSTEKDGKTSGGTASGKKEKKRKKSSDNGLDSIKEGSEAKTPSEEQASVFDQSPIPLESQVKFCQERVQQVEKNYGEMCQSFGSITRKSARLRDKGDILSKQISEMAKSERISHSTSKNMKEFAQNLAAIQDYRDAAIHRLENKVVKPLSAYGPKCKKVKSVIKTEQGAINKELKQRKQLDKVRDKKPGDEHAITATISTVSSDAETEFRKAAADATIGSKALCTQMGMFEKEKLADLKKVMADFVSIEMVFHAKAIEYYSQCFENLAMIDEEMDFDEFSRKMSVVQGGTMQMGTMPQQVPQGTMQGTMQSMGSTGLTSTMGSTLGSTSEYTSTGASYTYTYGESTGSSVDKRVRIQTQSMYDDDDDEDDDDDDDDDDEDEDDENGNPQHYSQPLRR